MGPFRTVWTALVSLYEETLVLIGGNLGAVVLNLPVGIVLFLIALPFSNTGGDEPNTQWLIALIAWLMTLLPTPGNVALAGLTAVAAGPDVPRFNLFKQTLATRWQVALRCSLVSVVILAVLLWNVSFYLGMGPGWPLFVSIFWLYASLFWLSLHIFLVPLVVHVAEPRVFDLYRRAAFVSLGHAPYTLVLLLAVLIVTFASVVFLPVYVLVAQSFTSLIQAHALREIRRRHGDLVVEAEEEVGRL